MFANAKLIFQIKKILKAFLLLLLVGMIGFMTWIYITPRYIPFVANKVSKEVSKLLPDNVDIKINGIYLGFERFYKPAIFLNEVTLFHETKGSASLKEIILTADLLAMIPQSQRNLLKFQFKSPEIKLTSIAEKAQDSKVELQNINDFLNNNRSKLLKYSLDIENTVINFSKGNEVSKNILVNHAILKPNIRDNKLIFIVYIDISAGSKTNVLDAVIDTNYDNQIKVKGSLTNLSGDLFNIFGVPLAGLENSNLEADVKFTGLFRNFSNIDYLEFDINNFEGNIRKNNFFSTDIKLKTGDIKGYCFNNCTELELDNVAFSTKNIDIVSNLSYKNTPLKKVVSANVSIPSTELNHFIEYWPLTVAPRTRNWISNNISQGALKNLQAQLHLDLDEVSDKKKLTQDSIKINFQIDGSTLTYMEGVPPIEDVSADLKINNDDISFKITRAKVINSKISNAHGTLYNLTGKNCYLSVDADLSGNAQDLADLAFAHASIANISYHNLIGHAKTQVSVKLPIQDEPLTLDSLDLNVNSYIDDFSAANIFEDYSLSKGKLVAKYKNKIINVTGTGLINDIAEITLNFKQNILSRDREASIQTKLDWNDLPLLGFSKPSFFNNSFNADIHVVDKADKDIKTLDIDLASSTILISKLGIKKKLGEQGNVKLLIETTKDRNFIKNYQVDLPNLQSSGSAVLTKDFRSLVSLNSDSTKLFKGNFSTELNNTNGGYSVIIKGDSLDLGMLGSGPSADKNASNEAQDESSSTIPNINASAKVVKLFMKNDIELSDATLNLLCKNNKCTTAQLSGTSPTNHYLNLNYNYPDISLESNDFGMATKAFGITRRIEDGNLTIKGHYSENDLLSGSVMATQFSVQKIPFLLKILSLTSVTGILVDGLNSIFGDQKGLYFERLNCPFTMENKLLRIKNCEANGSTIIIRTAGDIDFKSNLIKLNGSVGSRNIISDTISVVPIIGEILTGEDKSSLLGANFAINGTLDKPEVDTNPLSVLTPGAFKEVFK